MSLPFMGKTSATCQFDPAWRDRYRELFEEVTLVLCEGPHLAGRVASLGCPPRKLRVHHLGNPVQQIPFRPRVWEPKAPLKVLMAASFREKKGLPYGSEALGYLQHETPWKSH